MPVIEFVGGPLCGHAVKKIDGIDIVAIKSPVAHYDMYGRDRAMAVDPSRCSIDAVERVTDDRHIYTMEKGIHGDQVYLYRGML